MASRPPAKFEFDILQFLNRNPGATIRDVFEQFGRPQGYVRGTILKSLDRMLKKGLVQRETVDGLFRYRARQNSDELDRTLVESFIRDRLGGRLKPLASFLAETDDLDPEEVEQLRRMLDRKGPSASP